MCRELGPAEPKLSKSRGIYLLETPRGVRSLCVKSNHEEQAAGKGSYPPSPAGPVTYMKLTSTLFSPAGLHSGVMTKILHLEGVFSYSCD